MGSATADMEHGPRHEEHQQPQEGTAEAEAEATTTAAARRPRSLSSAAQSSLGRLTESPNPDIQHAPALVAPVWAGEGKGEDARAKPHAYLPAAGQRGGPKEDDTWWMRRQRPQQQQQLDNKDAGQEQGNEDEDESLVARIKEHKARAVAAAAAAAATRASASTSTAAIPATEEQQQPTKNLYAVSVAPWGLQHTASSTYAAQPSCSLFRCGPSPASSSSSSSSSSYMLYRIRVTRTDHHPQQEEGEEDTGKVCMRRYSEIRTMHELWLSRGLITATSGARGRFPPKAPPPLSASAAAALAQKRARRLQAYFECLLNDEENARLVQSPLFWSLFSGGRALVL